MTVSFLHARNLTMSRSAELPRSRSRSGGRGDRADTPHSSQKVYAVQDDSETPLSSVFLWLGRLLAFALILGAPWWLGSVEQLPQFALYCAAIGAMTMLWFALAFGKRTSHHFPWLAIPVILGVLLLAAQTLPLPDSVAQVVAAHQSSLYTAWAAPAPGELSIGDGSEAPVVRATMDLDGTRQALNLLVLGLTSLLIGSYFFSARKSSLLLPAAATINGVAISVFGIVQKLKFGRRIYGFIELPEGGQPFGPYVNQNNAAGYLLICLACSLGLVYAAFNRRTPSGARPRQIITREYPVWERARLHVGLFLAELNATKLAALLASGVIALGILACMSRGGLLGLAAGGTVAAVYYSMTRRTFSVLIVGSVVAVLVIAGGIWLGFGETAWRRMSRMSQTDFVTNELRMQHWTETAPAIVDFFPLGSGVGSYDNVHRMYREGNEDKIFYYAENQYFQTLVEAGVPGLLLLLTALVILVLCIRFLAVRGNSPKTAALSLIGVFLFVSQCTVALFDFGLFIPANMVAMAMVCGMIAGQAHSLADRLKRRFWFRVQFPLSLNMLLLLLAFSGALFCAMDALRYTRTELALGSTPAEEDFRTTSLEEIDERIVQLQAALQGNAEDGAWTRLGELYVLRYRLALHEKLTQSISETDDGDALYRVWLSTGLERLQALLAEARRANDLVRLRQLREDALVSDNLIPAVWYLKKSRDRNPVQATVHLLLAQLHVISPEPDAEVPHLRRARETAPAHAVTWFISGLMDLQARRLADATAHLKRCLEIDPSRYPLVARISMTTLPPERIVEEVLPEDAFMLNDFALNWLTLPSAQSLRIATLRQAEQLLRDSGSDDRKSLLALSEIQLEVGDLTAAAETLRRAVDLNRDTQPIRIKLVNVLIDLKQFDEAMDHLRHARRYGRDHQGLQVLEQKINRLRREAGDSGALPRE